MNKALEYRKILEKEEKSKNLNNFFYKKDEKNKIKQLLIRNYLDKKHDKLFNCFVWD